MAKTYNRLEIDVNKKPNSIGIRPVQNDTKSRYLDVCLYENGVAINLTGEQVRITFRKADGSTFFNQGEVTDATAGRCQFALTNEILSEAKAVEAQISVWNAGGQILSTQVFEIYVTAAIPWTDAVESENEFGVLVVLFQEIQNALDTMQHISDTFGEPGEKAAEYGVDTFWGILETLAGRGDVESSLQKGIKAYLNSTVGTSEFRTLDKMLNAIQGGMIEFSAPGTYAVQIPEGVKSILVTACGGGGAGAGNGSYTLYAGGNGGPTVVGNFFTLSGGYGAKDTYNSTTSSPGEGGGVGGGVGKNGGDGVKGSGGFSSGSTSSGASGGGGGGSLGNGGNGGDVGNSGSAGTKGGGGGGAGGYNQSSNGNPASGGSGAMAVVNRIVELNGIRQFNVTVGKGGTPNTSANRKGGAGGDGYVSIKWGVVAV